MAKTKTTATNIPEPALADHDSQAQPLSVINDDAPAIDRNSFANFPIVGIGASAGGLAAFEAFFSGMPADTQPGMAFVLVQHLAPDHKSILAEIIRRYTRMEVFEVEDGMQVLPNCAYIIPPNRDMAFINGTLQLIEPSAPRGQRQPIDFFFRSLAKDQLERAICIILSGTGSDGTLGVRAIKGEGGMAMVQNPDSTEYDGMPRSAINTGLIDYIMAPVEMPAQISAYVARAFKKSPSAVISPTTKGENALKKILIALRIQLGHDFSQYKLSTVHRRIERRMAVHMIAAIDEYAKYVQQTPAEAEALFYDLLIGVTSFFRDPDAFIALEKRILPVLFNDNTAGSLIRIWSAGCSTGEEAYSLAILLQEQMDMLKKNYKFQIFATDIDSRAIAVARSGQYPASIATDITPERLARFFTISPDGGSYRINKNIRDMMIFSEHNVIKDPPFSKLDLISCRNLLIYMSGDLQKRILPLFHYALNFGGWLFLGTSETVGDYSNLFVAIDRKMKLYQAVDDNSAPRVIPSRYSRISVAPELSSTKPAVKENVPVKMSLRELTEQGLLQHSPAAGALVDVQGHIHYIHGRTGKYLEPVTGEMDSYNILKMARQGLQLDLTIALHNAAKKKTTVSCPGLRVKTNGDFTAVNLTVVPIIASAATTPAAALYLVIIEELPASQVVLPLIADTVAVASSSPVPDENAHIAALRQELRIKEEFLQSSNEELETSNEELKSSNEEMQSVNEELQSTNEELETSKEELQSVNEELATVNAELQNKVIELSHANNDMNNLLAGTGIGTVFVDLKLNILRFTPAITKIIHLISSDVGRPVAHIASNLVGYDNMVADTQMVLDTLIPKAVEAQTTDGKWYTIHIMPYRTLDNVIKGAVVTFVDISELKKIQATLQELEARR
ncbi:MAG: chemotaxis protein CheB [Bacillota bacterium]